MAQRLSVQIVPAFGELPQAEIDDDEISEWIEEILNDARNHFVKSMSRGGGGGREYRRGGKTHRASAPGEYPATDGGRLVNSVDFEVSGRQGTLDTNIEYAIYLTTGTTVDGKVRMEKRKMLVEALTETLEQRPQLEKLAQAVSIEGIIHVDQ